MLKKIRSKNKEKGRFRGKTGSSIFAAEGLSHYF